MLGRREFLTQGIAAVSALTLPDARSDAAERRLSGSTPLRFLILGGTGHIGPYFVRAAVEAGHHVAVFSRQLGNSDLPSGVEHLIGDRNDNLRSIQGRDWDAVLDLATYGPGWVRSLGEALKGHVGRYTFISTISVYDHPEANKITDETSPVLVYHGSANPYSVTTEGPDYGALKILCEREAEKQFPGRVLIVRPASIAGPSDTHPYIFYWLQRMHHGGEVLAVGDPRTPVQFIDVRNLAEWIVRMNEKHGTGIYNAAGPAPPTDLAGLVNAARATIPLRPSVTWVTSSWLSTQRDKDTFNGLLFWEFNKGHLTGFGIARALAQGLTTRSVAVTMKDEWHWIQHLPAQTSVFTGFRPKADGSGFESVNVPWPTYLAREKGILTAWHRHERPPS